MIKPKKTIFTDAELNSLFDEWAQKGTKNNAYDYFIYEHNNSKIQDEYQNLYKKKGSIKKTINIELHHILPKFAGGSNESSNLIYLNIKDHIFAHWLRWKVHNQDGDLRAFLFRQYDSEERVLARRLLIESAREKDRQDKQGFFNSAFQQKQGKKGGSLGGSKNTPLQSEARHKVGKEFGRAVGLARQGSATKEFVQSYSFWCHDSKSELTYTVSPKEAFADVLRQLNEFIPGEIPEKNFASMYSLIKGERKKKYGWQIITTLIRSEVEGGLFTFKNKNDIIEYDGIVEFDFD
jgi:hypothetical protein